jgi:A/G-specific adenine glycosylase
VLADCFMCRQFPQSTLSSSSNTPASRKASAQKYIASLGVDDVDMSKADHVAAYPPLVHVFTHIRLTMHVYHFSVTVDDDEDIQFEHVGPPARRWVDAESMDEQTLSTGMRKCWDLVATSG